MSYYYAGSSTVRLRRVCADLRAAFGLSDFEFDVHDHWEYGWATGDGIHFNVTKASDSRTIETWIPVTPAGVNYQIILTAEAEPLEALEVISRALQSSVTRFA